MDPSKTEVAWMRFRFTVLGTVNLLELFEIPRRMTMRMTDPPLRDIMLELIQLSAKTHTTHNPWQREARRQALGFSLLVGLLSIANAKPAMEHFIKHTQRLEPVFTHIHDNFQRPLTIAELARIACLSASRFIRVFRMATGLPPLQYIKQARLNRALELLAATDLPVAMLAEQTGWPDQFHFCRTFKAKFGISPSAYRKMQQTMMF
jgi:AraC-like DNA-binding protein